MSDRLDDTLRHLARAEAPADLSARVRVALEMGPRPAPLWPTLAAAAVVVLLAVGGWLASDRGGGISAPRSAPDAAQVEPTAVDRRPSTSAGATADRKTAPSQVDVPVTTRGAEAPPPRATRVPPADHVHALPSLADIAAVGPAALSTPPMSVEATEIVPLVPIVPMEIPALDADGGEKR